jgi:hypothetical protein
VVVEMTVMVGSFTVLWLARDVLDRSVVDQQMAAGEVTLMRRRREPSRLIGAISDSEEGDRCSRS